MIKTSHIYGVMSIRPEKIMNMDNWGKSDIRMMSAQQIMDNCSTCVRSDVDVTHGSICEKCLNWYDANDRVFKPLFRPGPMGKAILEKDLRWQAQKKKRAVAAREAVKPDRRSF